MARLVVVSNRVAMPRERAARAGGLAIGLREALRKYGGVWFGWSGEIVETAPAVPKVVNSGKIIFVTVDLAKRDHDEYYTGYANGSLWPLLHYRVGLIEFRREAFAGYMRVNASMAQSLRPLIQPDDLIWVHDYHLMPFAFEMRKLGITNKIGFFLHTPFPPAAVLAVLPGHESLMEAMCAYDLIGLQTLNDLRALADYIRNEAGGTVAADGTARAFGRAFRVGAFPIGIDAEPFAKLAKEQAASPESGRLKQNLADRHLIIGVDRLDYSKGLPNRFLAIDRLLAAHSEHRRKMTYLQIAPPSRTDVAQYRALRRELEAVAGRINGRYAEFDWQPIRYLNKGMARATLAGFFRLSRVGLVTPLRDGMNLVAKEYVAAQDSADPGVLILSRFAGAAYELDSALIVNPFDVDAIADAIQAALTMPLDERQKRWRALEANIRSNTVITWRENFLEELRRAPDREVR